jgi:hypothetical protein
VGRYINGIATKNQRLMGIEIMNGHKRGNERVGRHHHLAKHMRHAMWAVVPAELVYIMRLTLV